ncbi:unnamed protein product [Medioppia subpectinata]|uniref:Nuclear receptor domain-containing protein n=1 Tax=Medioppia subpectinata TaxID=1979941 RepID=A0A7R9PTR7_9ACAR|nr:unnamed protein product [Medioppia subpectinata]CAG2100419.1 unnamed protein product [Medioppia subpectinata]
MFKVCFGRRITGTETVVCEAKLTTVQTKGKHFNAITCESCKIIFRRNAYKYETLLCIKDNNCIIDVLRRKGCKKCRLRKCFAVGMRRERILSEEERGLRLEIIRENRLKRQKSTDMQKLGKNPNNNRDNTVVMHTNNNNEHGKLIGNVCPYSAYLAVESSLNTYNAYFNDMETNRLRELYSLPTITSDYQLDVINKYCKNIVSQTVGNQLLAIFLEQIVTKNVNTCKDLKAFNDLNYKRYVFANVLADLCDWDNHVVNLMIALILFNPNRPHLIHRDVIEFQQHVYKHLLQKYLKFKYRSEYESSHNLLVFLKLMARLVFRSVFKVEILSEQMFVNVLLKLNHIPMDQMRTIRVKQYYGSHQIEHVPIVFPNMI